MALLLLGSVRIHAQTNDWTNTSAGKWEVGANWSRGTPPGTNDTFDNIFRTGSSVTLDATTSGSFPNTMTVNSVAVAAPAGTLELDNAGTNIPLHILLNLDVTDGSVLAITNSALQVDGVMTAGYLPLGYCYIELDSGWEQLDSVTLGGAGVGNLYLYGGTLTVLGSMTLASMPGGSGLVDMYGGTLSHTNAPLVLGDEGSGWLLVNGGSVQALGIELGNAAGSRGLLSVVGGTVSVSSNILIGNNNVTNPCSATVSTNGTLIVTNAAGTAYIDVAQNGSLTLNGGVLQLDNLILTNGGTFTNLAGAFTLIPPLRVDNGSSAVLSSGTNTFASGLHIGSTTGSTGSVVVANCVVNVSSDLSLGGGTNSSGTLNLTNYASVSVTNGPVLVGPVGSGRISVSSGSSLLAETVKLGGTGDVGSGELDVLAGGFVKVLTNLSANFIVVDCGDLDGSGGTLVIGESHNAEMDLTCGGATNFGFMYIGYTIGFTGTFHQSGGTAQVTNQLIVGAADCGSGAVGMAMLSGGALYVTNAGHTAVLDVRNGTFVLNSGATLVVDNLVLTNACGHFANLGGTLIQNNPPTLAPKLDADGDGQSNAAEALAGTDPLDPASVFRMISATVVGQDLQVDWTTEGGHSYVVQWAPIVTGAPGNFVDLSPVISVGGSGPGTTSYVHVGAASNRAGFYRVRLGP